MNNEGLYDSCEQDAKDARIKRIETRIDELLEAQKQLTKQLAQLVLVVREVASNLPSQP